MPPTPQAGPTGLRSAKSNPHAVRQLGGAYAWYVVGVLVLAYSFSFLDRQILSLLVEPMKRDMGLSDTQVSLLQGIAFAAFNALAGLPLGRLVDTTRRTVIVAAGIAFWSAMTVGCGLAKSYPVLLAMRMGVGAGEATLTPAAHSMIADYFKPEKIGLPLAIYSMGIFIGGGLALVIGASVIAHVASIATVSLPMAGRVFGWQLVFVIVGAPGLLVAVLSMTLREPKRTGMLKAGPDVQSSHVPLATVWAFLKANGLSFGAVSLAFGLAAMAAYGLAAWIPSFFIRVHGWSAAEIGRAYGLIFIVFGPLGVLCGGVLGDLAAARGLRNPRITVVMGVMLVAAPFVALFPLVADPRLALALVAGSVFFPTFINGLAPAIIVQMVPNQMRGLAVAASLLVVNLVGLGLGPTAIAVVTDYVWHDSQKLGLSLAIVPLLALTLALLFLAFAYRPYLKTLDYLRAWNLERA